MTAGSAPLPIPTGTSPSRIVYAPRITANRRRIDDRFPSLGFSVDTGGLPFFEVLLCTDASLFDPANAARRTEANFYSSAQHHGLIPAAESVHPFLVPSAVLRRFASATPRAHAVFFTAISYQGHDGSGPAFAQPPKLLTSEAPSVTIAKDFTGTTLATVLSVSVDKLRRVGATFGAQVAPSDGEDAGEAEDGYGAQPLSYRDPPPSMPPPPAARRPTQPSGRSADAASDSYPSEDYQLAVLPGDGAQPPRPATRARPKDPLLPGQDPSQTNGHRNPSRSDGYRGTMLELAQGADFESGQPEPDYLVDDEDDRDYSATAALGAGYHDEVDEMDRHPRHYQSLDGPSTTPAASARPLAADDKMRIMERVAAFESNNDYGAINADGEYEGRFGTNHPAYHRYHVGLSYGFIQFTQDSGRLGELLGMMRTRDPNAFGQCFGPDADQLILVTTTSGPPSIKSPEGRSARVRPVAGADLWQEPWVGRFRAAGHNPQFQAAQRELAARGYLDPILEFAGWLGLDTERALSMVFDRSVHMGVNGAKRWIISAVGPLGTDPLRQQALAALGFADLRSFQASVPHLAADGAWGPDSHAAMVGALRRMGASSPVPVPTTDQMIEAMVRRAGSEPWHARVETLRSADIADVRFGL